MSKKPPAVDTSADRFAYKSIASIVHRQSRTRDNQDASGGRIDASPEPTGESVRVTTASLKSLMGTRAYAAPNATNKPTSSSSKSKAISYKDLVLSGAEEASLDEDGTGLFYVPKTKGSKEAWERFLGTAAEILSSVPRDVLRSAAEEAVIALKDVNSTSNQKKTLLETIFGEPLRDATYRVFADASEALTDFQLPSASRRPEQDSVGERGITVVIESEDEDEIEGDGALDEDKFERNVVELEEEEKVEKSEERDLAEEAVSSGEDYLDPLEIDAFWLNRRLTNDEGEEMTSSSPTLVEDILSVLGDQMDVESRETRLVELFAYQRFDLIKLILRNRAAVYYGTKWSRATSDEEREGIRQEMERDELDRDAVSRVASRFDGVVSREAIHSSGKQGEPSSAAAETAAPHRELRPSPGAPLDLKALAHSLDDSARKGLLNSSVVTLPKGSWKSTEKSFEQVVVPALAPKPTKDELVLISSLPFWMRPAFAGMTELNRVQSKVFPAVSSAQRENLLVCAPTGAGKTNIAVLAILNELAAFVKEDGRTLDALSMSENMKIVYVAPMKALVQEVVANLSQRFSREPYHLIVKELSGDAQLTRQELIETHVIVTTPEKWDVVTRKASSSDRSFVRLVKLVIVDEIHLLHDTRGAVLEAIISRTLRSSSMFATTKGNSVRLLGISATLPNYMDVAMFLRVNQEEGLFHFDATYRPVPLEQIYVGITERKPLNRLRVLDEQCSLRVQESLREGHQVMVFVHTRKDTVKTARMLLAEAQRGGDETSQIFLSSHAHSAEVLNAVSGLTPSTDDVVASSKDLRDLLPYGIGVHNAGLSRADRTLVEDLFAAGHVRVLVSTATLAWGVNLPAHTVIIKGTQVYDPSLGRWTELSQLDVLQMLGRAGRPQYDKSGVGVILTTHAEMSFYLSLLNTQLSVESRLLAALPDHLNAEIASGNVTNVKEAVAWLAHTFLYVRALREPFKYGAAQVEDDVALTQWRVDLVHSACVTLDECGLIRYDKRNGAVFGTTLGRIASHYYLSPASVRAFNTLLTANSFSDSDVFRVISVADEFKNVRVRHEERLELSKLMDRVPVPIKESLEDPSAKINVLLQAYISRAQLQGFALACDLVFVHQSAARIARAIHAICVHRAWPKVARAALEVCIMIERRLWRSQTPLRQLGSSAKQEQLHRQIERKSIAWSKFAVLTETELSALVRDPKMGKSLAQTIQRFPKLDVVTSLQTLSRNAIKLDLTLTADFQYDPLLHGPSVQFWIYVEDPVANEGDGKILHVEPYLWKARFHEESHVVTIHVVDLPDAWSPYIFVRIEADRFLHAKTTVPINLMKIVAPSKPSTYAELQDWPAQSLEDVFAGNDLVVQYLTQCLRLKKLWPTQRQAAHALCNTDANVFHAASMGTGLCLDLALFRALQQQRGEEEGHAPIVYVSARKSTCDATFAKWSAAFETMASLRETRVARLKGENQKLDLALLKSCEVLVVEAKHWEALTRRWRLASRKVVRNLRLILFDDLHDVAWSPSLELCVTRARFIAASEEEGAEARRGTRFVATSLPVSDTQDVASWLDVSSKNVLAFNAGQGRPAPLDISVRGFAEPVPQSRLDAMTKTVFESLHREREVEAPSKSVVIVPSRRTGAQMMVDLAILHAASAEEGAPPLRFGLLHSGVSNAERANISKSFGAGELDVCLWVLEDDQRTPTRTELTPVRHVVVVDTLRFDARQRRYVEYAVSTLTSLGALCADPSSESAKLAMIVLAHEPARGWIKTALHAPLALESALRVGLSDALLGEIVGGTVESKEEAVRWLTWTLFYRRLSKNPAYYGLSGADATETVNAFLSTLVDGAVEELRAAECVASEEEDEDALVVRELGLIAAHYDVSFATMEIFAAALRASSRVKSVLEICCSATELAAHGSVRAREDKSLERLARHVTSLDPSVPAKALEYTEPHVKSGVLLQAHLHRLSLHSLEQKEDLHAILLEMPRLLAAVVDVAASKGWLRPALAAMELTQCLVQAVKPADPPAMQLPGIERAVHKEELLRACESSVLALTELEDEERDRLLAGMNPAAVAEFCNTYPSVDLAFELAEPAGEDEDAQVQVLVTRDEDEDDEAQQEERWALASRFPGGKRLETWWVVLGDAKTHKLLAVKKLELKGRETRTKLSFTRDASHADLCLWLKCDSYVGSDVVKRLHQEGESAA